MNEENKPDDTDRKSAFYGTSDDERQLSATTFANEIHRQVGANQTTSILVGMDYLTTLRTTKYGHATALLIPEKCIPKHERRDDIIEAVISKMSEHSRRIELYTTHKPGYKRAYLDLAQIGARAGEVIGLVGTRLYGMEDLVRDFNLAKPRGMEDVVLENSQGVNFEGLSIPLTEAKMRTYQGMVLLDANLGIAGPIKIQKMVSGFELRLKDHTPIKSFARHGTGVWLTYTRSNNDTKHTRLVVNPERSDFQPPRLVKIDFRKSKVRQPRETGGPYEVDVDEKVLNEVVDLLASSGYDNYGENKGEIAEALVREVMTQLGLKFLRDHPFSPSWWPSRTKMPGPDMLSESLERSELVYVEAKWWDKTSDAMRDAVAQLQRDLKKYPTCPEGRVRAGYAAVVEWRAESARLRIFLKRVETSEVKYQVKVT